MDYFLLNCLLALAGEKAFLSVCVCIRDRCTLGWRYLIETYLDGSGASPSQASTAALSTLMHTSHSLAEKLNRRKTTEQRQRLPYRWDG